MEDKSLPKNWNEQFADFRKTVGSNFKVGLYCSDSPYQAKFSDSQLTSMNVVRWIASYSYEPKHYDVWQKSGHGSGGFGTYTGDIDRDVDPNDILHVKKDTYAPTTNDVMIRQIILQPGFDNNGIYGLICSPDNGLTNKVYWTVYGRKYYQEDADHLWPFLIDKIKEITGDSLNISWNDIQNKPDVATQADLKNIELKPGPQGEPGVPGTNGKDGIDGKDGQPGRDGTDGKSAYQIWLDNGHSGTETDFLNSLKGAKGDPGQNGTNGKDGKDAIDTVKTITSGTLSSLSTGKYEIECLPSDTPIQEWGLCDVVVGQHYAKQVFTVTGATDDNQGNVYVRVRDYSGQWHEWREITAWN
jgi:hypothetical protein